MTDIPDTITKYAVKLSGTLNGVKAQPEVLIEVENGFWVMVQILLVKAIDELRAQGYKSIDVKLVSINFVV